MITYNQAAFVRQAVESVLSQAAGFHFELLASDDCSSDETPGILSGIASSNPVLKPLLHSNNQGMNRNFLGVIKRCRGEYIAFLEGDDYWTDSGKLQAQADYLDRHPECVICHHRVTYIETPGGNQLREFPPEERRQDVLPADLLAYGNFIQTCALMIRRTAVPEIPESFFDLKLGDWPLCALVGQEGSVGYIDRNMAHYRVHSDSSWTPKTEAYKEKATLEMYDFLLKNLNRRARKPWIAALLHRRLRKVASASSGNAFQDYAKSAISLVADTAIYRCRALPIMVLRCIRFGWRHLRTNASHRPNIASSQ